MATTSASSVTTLPLTSSSPYETATLTWIQRQINDGEGLLKQDPAYGDINSNIAYVMGDQLSRRPSQLNGVKDNRLKKVILETTAALTDIHPIFGFVSANPAYSNQVVILDKLTRAWWNNSYADLYLADVIRYSATCGAGYCEVNWERTLEGGKGDTILTPVDPRDVFPIAPKFNFTVQSWGGVIIRSTELISTLQDRYGDRAYALRPDTETSAWTNRAWGSGTRVASPALNTVDYINARAGHNQPQGISNSKDVYKVYYRDNRCYTGNAPITMGEKGTNWSYIVYPLGYVKPDGTKATKEESRLYPRGRLIVATVDRVLYDGPNPYWHGMFPICKLSLDPWPWSLLGGSVVGDLRTLQDAVHTVVNGYLDQVNKILRPMVVADKNSVPASQLARFDTRLPGQKITQNPNAGQGIRVEPPPPFPSDVEKFLEFCLSEMDQLSGVANLSALATLNQAPSADSIEKLQEALNPILRLKSRMLEVFLRELGTMLKSNFFQFYTMARRIAILGENGVDLHDFDFQPGNLIPAFSKGAEGYDGFYDADVPVAQRAAIHNQNFTLQITPGSLLAISQLSRKLTYLQLWQGGRPGALMDPWSLWEVFDIPNAGSPPEGVTTIPERIKAAQDIGLMIPTLPPALPGLGGGLPPEGVEGRPPTNGEPPQFEQKTTEGGLPRQTLATS